MILYCDVVSKKPKLVVLNSDLKPVEEYIFGVKVSEEFHEKIHYFLTKFIINHLLAALGPGSYTGIRLIDLFSFLWIQKGKQYSSFYYFECAEFLKKPFISYAYKKESFVVQHKEKNLIPYEEKSYESYVTMPGETHYPGSEILDPSHYPEFLREMLNQNRQLKPYYYRTIDHEFKKSS